MRICKRQGCGNSLEGMKSNATYCSSTCRSADSQRRKVIKEAAGLSGLNMQPLYQPLQPMQQPMQASSNSDFILQSRIQELTKERDELRADIKEQQKKIDDLKDRLRDRDIELMKNEKPEGLGGLPPEMLGMLMQHAPQLIEGFTKLTGGNNQPAQVGGLPNMELPTQQRVMAFAQSMTEMPEPQQKAFFNIVTAVYNGQNDQAISLINQYNTTYGTNKAVNS